MYLIRYFTSFDGYSTYLAEARTLEDVLKEAEDGARPSILGIDRTSVLQISPIGKVITHHLRVKGKDSWDSEPSGFLVHLEDLLCALAQEREMNMVLRAELKVRKAVDARTPRE